MTTESKRSNWWKVTTKSVTATRNIRKKIMHNGVQDWAVAGQRVTLIKLRPDHVGGNGSWWEKFRKDFTIKEAVPCPEPELNIAFCGMKVVDSIPIGYHIRSCSSCIRIKENEGSKGNGKGQESIDTSVTSNISVTSDNNSEQKNKPLPKVSPVETKVSVKGLTDVSLNGLLSVMKESRDRTQQILDSYDKAIKAVEELESLGSMLKEIESEMGSHRQALKYFLGKEYGI